MTRAVLVVCVCECVSIFMDNVGVNMWKAHQIRCLSTFIKSRFYCL